MLPKLYEIRAHFINARVARSLSGIYKAGKALIVVLPSDKDAAVLVKIGGEQIDPGSTRAKDPEHTVHDGPVIVFDWPVTFVVFVLYVTCLYLLLGRV